MSWLSCPPGQYDRSGQSVNRLHRACRYSTSRNMFKLPEQTVRHAKQIVLPDGRSLAYLDDGPLDGKPVFFFHGFAMSALCAPLASQIDGTIRVRILSVDRPGIGRSSPHRSRTLRSWAADIGALADALSLDRFAVVGWSAGGPHALACAAHLSSRIGTVGVVASAPPFDDRQVSSMMPRRARWLAAVARRAPQLLNPIFGAHVRAVRKNPEKAFASALNLLCAADQQVATNPLIRPDLMASMIAAGEGGPHGLVDDVKCLVRPWDFDLNAVAAPVCIFHGSSDTIVPEGVSRIMSGKFRRSTLKIIPEDGHFLYASRWAELIEHSLRVWNDC